jgi:protein tyrosine/serine phosphatase
VLTAASQTAGAQSAAPGAETSPIKRFAQLDARVYRGAQPDEAGFRFLRDQGVKTIVSFRDDAVTFGAGATEQELVESLGMRFVSIPVTFRAFGWGDDFDVTDMHKFLSVVDDPASGPVFFHCRRGSDRTGSFAAIYRIARQGWSEEEALDETRTYNMRWWYFPMREMVKDFAKQAPALAETPQ